MITLEDFHLLASGSDKVTNCTPIRAQKVIFEPNYEETIDMFSFELNNTTHKVAYSSNQMVHLHIQMPRGMGWHEWALYELKELLED